MLFYRVMKVLLTPIFLLFLHTTAGGKKRALQAKPVVLTGNHLCWFDIISLGIQHKRPVHALGKKELAKGAFAQKMLARLGMIPVDRGAADLDSMRKVIKLLKNGNDLAIYPEGTRNRVDNRLCKIHGGAAMFAIKAKSAIVPFATNRRPQFFRRNFMVFGDPYELDSFYGQRVDSAILEQADAVVKEKLIETKRMVDYLATLKRKPRRFLLSLLDNPAIDFRSVYETFLPRLLPFEQSVAPEDFDQHARRDDAKA